MSAESSTPDSKTSAGSNVSLPRARSTFENGDRVGRYIIREAIGEGGMGAVYSAFDPELDRTVAIKVVRANGASSANRRQRRARMVREAQAQARIAHPNVVPVLDVGTHDDGVFLTMELVEGATLREWLAEDERTWSQTVRVFIGAGRGLAVAHGSGLVHRDFKPTNVMVNRRGRAQVTDFGLARAVDEVDDDTPEPSSELATSLTRTGTLLGTPRYMAPEQHAGESASTRSDQFAFCVALYEALYGEHPFFDEVTTVAEIAAAILDGKLKPEPKGSDVPARIRRALVKGMSFVARDRFASMQELLDDLARNPEVVRRRRVAMGVSVVAATSLGVVIALWLGPGSKNSSVAQSSVCRGAQSQLDAVWNDGRKHTIAKAFARTKLSHQADSYARSTKLIDKYGQDWRQARTSACEATRVHKEQSENALDLRMQCFDQRLQELDAVLETFTKADTKVVDRAVNAASKLSPVTGCANSKQLAARFAPPKDASKQTAIRELRAQLARARALENSGRYKDGLSVAAQASKAAVALAYRPLEAEARYQLGSLQRLVGSLADAEKNLQAAVLAASASGHVRVEAKAWIQKVYVVGFRQHKFKEGLRAADHAQALVERLGDDELRASLASSRGLVYAGAAKFDKALVGFKTAVRLREAKYGKDSLEVVSTLNNVALAYHRTGKYDRSTAIMKRVLNIQKAKLGEAHPKIGASLNNLGAALMQHGKREQALVVLRQALAIRSKHLGKNHADTGMTHHNIGEALRELGRYKQALAAYQTGLRIRKQALGPEHRDVGDSYDSLGATMNRMSKPDEAIAYLQKAYELRRKHHGDKPHSEIGMSLTNLGDTYSNQGKFKLAIDHFRKARVEFRKVFGPKHPYLAIVTYNISNTYTKMKNYGKALTNAKLAVKIGEAAYGNKHSFLAHPLSRIGQIEIEQNRPGRAIAPLERALVLRVGGAPYDRAETMSRLSVALWESGKDRKRAITLAKQARSTFAKVKDARGKRAVSEMDAWLAKRGKR